VPLLEKHLQLEPCAAISLANDECAPMAKYIRELVRQELESRRKMKRTPSTAYETEKGI
jgi:hypothetical protein